LNPLRRIAPEPRRTTSLGLRFVADPAGLGSFAERVLRERNLYGALAFAETAESMRLCQAGLRVGPGDRVAGIGSSGDMLLSFLSEGAEAVVGFDTNPTQVALASLKLAAIQHLAVEEYLALFGVAAASGRWRLELFDRLSRATSADVRRTLVQRRGWVPKGILNHGMTHLIIRALVNTVSRLVDRETMELFLGEHGTDQERARSLDALVGRASTRLVVGQFTQRLAGQLKWLFFPHKLCRVSHRPDEMIADFFTTFRPLFVRGAKGNPVLARSAQGDLHPEWSAHLYDEGRFSSIADAAQRVRFEARDLTSGLASLPPRWATKLYLSNAPDYLTPEELDALVAQVQRVAAPGARVLHFSLLDEDRIGDRLGAEAPGLDALRATDNVHLYPTIAVRVFGA
jgi:S-adenosylmethionine:diacylglycerol 3-amino-3-carboxypropyl transferase